MLNAWLKLSHPMGVNLSHRQRLKEAIEQFLQAWNEAPRPFVWTATVEKIMVKIERARQKLEGIKPGWSNRKKRKKQR